MRPRLVPCAFCVIAATMQGCCCFVFTGMGDRMRAPRLFMSTEGDDSLGNLLHGNREKAFPQQTPHSGCHFVPSHPAYRRPRFLPSPRRRRGRYFEGWYYRVTLPEENASFAFIVSIEDPGRKPKSDLALAAIQIMGPDDEYLVQADKDDTKFWAWRWQQGFGFPFEYQDSVNADDMRLRTAMSPEEWREKVKHGFQALPNHIQGRISGHDGSFNDVLEGGGIPGECDFDMSIEPLTGWGDDEVGVKSTAGWLASFPVFEPHWQVTMSDGRATGSIRWKNKTYEFYDAPFYAEKNWGGAFPTQWYWVQCNSFEGYTDRENHLSITAGGGTRKIPFGKKESLGMVSLHHNGTFYEAVPWTGTMEWSIATWGYWKMKGRCTSGDRLFESELVTTCKEEDGVVLRAPTENDGLKYFCRDSFYGDATVSLYELCFDKEKKEYVRADKPPIINKARTKHAAVEIGGGPWWDEWKGTSEMKQPMRSLVKLPYMFSRRRK